jgi:hypothetical protein
MTGVHVFPEKVLYISEKEMGDMAFSILRTYILDGEITKSDLCDAFEEVFTSFDISLESIEAFYVSILQNANRESDEQHVNIEGMENIALKIVRSILSKELIIGTDMFMLQTINEEVLKFGLDPLKYKLFTEILVRETVEEIFK